MKIALSFILAVLFGFVGGIAGALAILHHDSLMIKKLIRASSFELVNQQGQVVSVWGIDQNENPLLVFGPSNGQNSGDMSTGFQQLSISDRDSQRVAIGLTAQANPFFMFRGRVS